MLPSGVVRGRRNPLHLGFAHRLTRARKAAGMSGSALSLAAGMTADAAWSLEAGGRVPRVDTVERLAKVLQLSPCFLAFGVEQPCDPSEGLLSAGLADRLLQVRESKSISRQELGRCSETSDSLVRMTETRATVPNIAKVEQLAKALDVSPCWLAFGLGNKELPQRRGTRPAEQSADQSQ